MTSLGSTRDETQTCPSIEAVAIYTEFAGTAGTVEGRAPRGPVVVDVSPANEGVLPEPVLPGTPTLEGGSLAVVVTEATGENGLTDIEVMEPE